MTHFPPAPTLWALCETSRATPRAQTEFGEEAAWRGVQDVGVIQYKALGA